MASTHAPLLYDSHWTGWSEVSSFAYTVGIPTKNRSTELQECLGRVFAQTIQPDEVLIADDGDLDSDEVQAWFQGKLPRLRLVRKPRSDAGLEKSLELITRLCGTDWLLLLDDDILIPATFVQQLVDAMPKEPHLASRIGGVGGIPVNQDCPSPTARVAARRALERLFLLGGGPEGRFLISGFCTDYGQGSRPAAPYEVEHIPGGLSLWRTDVLRLRRRDVMYQGYSYGVDKQMAYEASREWTLLCVPAAQALHLRSPAARPDARALGRMKVRHQRHFFRSSFQHRFGSRVAFYWAMAGQILIASGGAFFARDGSARREQLRGMLDALLERAEPIDLPASEKRGARIVFLVELLERGGIQLQLLEVIRDLTAAGHKCTLVSFRRERDVLSDLFVTAGAEVVFLGKEHALDPAFLLRLSRCINSCDVGVVHAMTPRAAMWACAVLRRKPVTGSPHLIASVLNNHELQRVPVRLLQNLLVARRADCVQVNSRCAARAYRAAVPSVKAIRRIYNGVAEAAPATPERRMKLRQQLGIGPDDFAVVSVGRLVAVKAHRDALLALRALRAGGSQMRLFLIGDGPLRRQLELDFGDLAATQAAVFLGDCADVPALLPAFDAFVLPSDNEGLPNALLEAMAAGLPCVASAVGGIPEVLNETNGILVPAGNPELLAQQLLTLEKSTDQRAILGRCAAETARRRFGMKQMLTATQEMYFRFLRPRPRVAYVLSQFPRVTETFIMREIAEMRRRGLRVDVISLKPPPTRDVHPLARRLRRNVITAPWISAGVIGTNLRVFLRSPFLYASAFARLLLLQSGSVTDALKGVAVWPKAVACGDNAVQRGAVHFHAHWANVPTSCAAALGLLFHMRFSFTGHAFDIYRDQPNLRRKLEQAAFTVTCTERNRAHMSELLGGNADGVRLIRHFLDRETIGLLQARASRPNPGAGQPVTILTVGALEPYKGHDVLLRALAVVCADKRDVRLRIIGAGPQESELRSLARSLFPDATDRVSFLGALPQERVFSEMGEADLFVLASIEKAGNPVDNLPNVLVEAALTRLPLIASNVGSVSELVIDGETGLTVRPGSVDALAAAILRLLTDRPLAATLAERACARAESMFGVEDNASVLEELLRNALEKREVSLYLS